MAIWSGGKPLFSLSAIAAAGPPGVPDTVCDLSQLLVPVSDRTQGQIQIWVEFALCAFFSLAVCMFIASEVGMSFDPFKAY